MKRLGVIPAAGKSKRFGGLYKELLPCGADETLLSRAVDTLEMIPVDTTVIVTSHYKINAHSMALNNRNVVYALQNDYSKDIWGAIETSFALDADWYYFIMPDTYQEQGRFPANPVRDFTIGIFDTWQPENYGVLLDGRITDKNTTLSGEQYAWGAVTWSRECVNLWRRYRDEITNYAQAFNMAMEKFGYETYRIGYYFDCGNMERYKELLRHV